MHDEDVSREIMHVVHDVVHCVGISMSLSLCVYYGVLDNFGEHRTIAAVALLLIQI